MADTTEVAPPTLARWRAALTSEWIKLRSIRSTVALPLVALVLTVGAGLGTCASYGHTWAGMTTAQRAMFDPTAASFNGLDLATILIGITGVLIISGEYGSGLIRTTLVATPQRGLVLAAKAMVFTVVSWLVATVTSFATFLAGQSFLPAPVPHAAFSDPGVVRAVFGAGTAVALYSLLGLALGALMRSTAAGIGLMVVLLYIVPGVAGALPTTVHRAVMPYLPSSAGHALYTVVQNPNLELPPSVGLALLVGYVTVLLALAAVLLVRRDA